ncbi:hypothetical protein BG011_006577 [Mortierella polycephala]|uniref:Uncharacterized protein n=1 Tax=Mortierella polycephala TaxID=41804 RepID=A0A9P6TZD7_9FUNG|nr:hypothetical protein BG011_006577 [Mortierella polycephala]
MRVAPTRQDNGASEFRVASQEFGGLSPQQKLPMLMNKMSTPVHEIEEEPVNHLHQHLAHHVQVGLNKPMLTVFSSMGGRRDSSITTVAFDADRETSSSTHGQPKEFVFREEDFQPLLSHTKERGQTMSSGLGPRGQQNDGSFAMRVAAGATHLKRASSGGTDSISTTDAPELNLRTPTLNVVDSWSKTAPKETPITLAKKVPSDSSQRSHDTLALSAQSKDQLPAPCYASKHKSTAVASNIDQQHRENKRRGNSHGHHAIAVPAHSSRKIPHRQYEQEPGDHHDHYRHQCNDEYYSNPDDGHELNDHADTESSIHEKRHQKHLQDARAPTPEMNLEPPSAEPNNRHTSRRHSSYHPIEPFNAPSHLLNAIGQHHVSVPVHQLDPAIQKRHRSMTCDFPNLNLGVFFKETPQRKHYERNQDSGPSRSNEDLKHQQYLENKRRGNSHGHHVIAVPARGGHKIPQQHYEQEPGDHHDHRRHQCDDEYHSNHDARHEHNDHADIESSIHQMRLAKHLRDARASTPEMNLEPLFIEPTSRTVQTDSHHQQHPIRPFNAPAHLIHPVGQHHQGQQQDDFHGYVFNAPGTQRRRGSHSGQSHPSGRQAGAHTHATYAEVAAEGLPEHSIQSTQGVRGHSAQPDHDTASGSTLQKKKAEKDAKAPAKPRGQKSGSNPSASRFRSEKVRNAAMAGHPTHTSGSASPVPMQAQRAHTSKRTRAQRKKKASQNASGQSRVSERSAAQEPQQIQGRAHKDLPPTDTAQSRKAAGSLALNTVTDSNPLHTPASAQETTKPMHHNTSTASTVHEEQDDHSDLAHHSQPRKRQHRKRNKKNTRTRQIHQSLLSMPDLKLNELFVEQPQESRTVHHASIVEDVLIVGLGGIRNFVGAAMHMPAMVAHALHHDKEEHPHTDVSSHPQISAMQHSTHTPEHSKAAMLKRPSVDLSLYPEEESSYPRGDTSHHENPAHPKSVMNVTEIRRPDDYDETHAHGHTAHQHSETPAERTTPSNATMTMEHDDVQQAEQQPSHQGSNRTARGHRGRSHHPSHPDETVVSTKQVQTTDEVFDDDGRDLQSNPNRNQQRQRGQKRQWHAHSKTHRQHAGAAQ